MGMNKLQRYHRSHVWQFLLIKNNSNMFCVSRLFFSGRGVLNAQILVFWKSKDRDNGSGSKNT